MFKHVKDETSFPEWIPHELISAFEKKVTSKAIGLGFDRSI